jgi:hypothetical protein
MNGAMFPERCAAVINTSPEDSVDPMLSRISAFDSAQVTDEVVRDVGGHQIAAAMTTESVPEVDPPLPKKRSRKKGSKKKSQADDIVKEKLVALSKTGRVKTTEELVADLKSRTVSGSAAAAAASASDDSVGRTISVKPSLSNSVSAAATPDSGTTAKQKKEEKLDPETRVEREIAEILSKLPPINVDEIVWDDSPDNSAPATPKPITEEDVDRYLQQEWDGVNGCVTHVATPPTRKNEDECGSTESSSFRGWHEMVARRTYNDDLIHILPYSIVD